MPNMNAQTVRELWQMFKIRSKVMVKVTSSKFKLLSERPCHKGHVCQILKALPLSTNEL